MSARPGLSIAKLTAVVCIIGADLGLIGRWVQVTDWRWHDFLEGLGCCGSTDHCYCGVAQLALAIYIGGFLYVAFRVREVHRRFFGYALTTFLVIAIRFVTPSIDVGKTFDPAVIVMAYLVSSSFVFVIVGTILGERDRYRAYGPVTPLAVAEGEHHVVPAPGGTAGLPDPGPRQGGPGALG